MANSAGGAFIPDSPQLDGDPVGSMFRDRVVKTAAVYVNGTQLHGMTNGVQGWQNPEATAILIHRVICDITTVATGACTLDIGYTATSAVTTSDTFLDGIDANAAIAVFDSMNAALDSGANANCQKAAIGKWVTVDEKTGDATGMIAVVYIQYSTVVTP